MVCGRERGREEMEDEANPGVLVTLPSGIQYRQLDAGRQQGKVVAKAGPTNHR